MERIIEKIKKYEKIIIHRHTYPDGDALGSQIGLKEAIKASFPKKQVLITGDESERYNFIGQMDKVEDQDYQGALVIVLDTAEEMLISDSRYKNGEFLIKIDHHLQRTGYGDIEYVDTSYESCAGLIANFIFENRLTLTDEGAKALYTGIVTDSGRFRFDSVTPQTFRIAAKLMEYNFKISDIYKELYLDNLEMVLLRAKFTLKFRLTTNKVAYIKTTQAEIKEYNVDANTISRGMVNVMSGIKGIEIWVNFTEDENNNVLAEIRSSKYNINEIASKYGGGGHLLASGASLNSFKEADRMLEDLNNLLKGNE
ncbi:MAG: bifunctional oligoribonuclease/PAP phosphatase NrnA [Bacilli bacterium]|nr:bifunctional oligoribonuclease/PAP phosphatase NrnA [Bacilli bacterium]